MQAFNQILHAFGFYVNFSLYQPVLPIGISFYTFQAISYLIDVYWRRIPYERSFIGFGTYISMFPQLIAGPIVTYSAVKKQIEKRRISFLMIEGGLREWEMTTPLFLLGCVQIGLSIRDMDLLTIGMMNDMYAESRNDECHYPEPSVSGNIFCTFIIRSKR